jgi:2-amino-4-hydroxy-6-hydroxymethyldihydropteridine diphosphokinase
MDNDLVFISLGSNVGNRLNFLTSALNKISTQAGKLILKSSVFETEAWGNVTQQNFFNQIIAIKTNYEATELMYMLLEIEHQLGRTRSERNGPRSIDLDIIFYKDQIIREAKVKVPHPRMHLRNFILIPMNEICSEWMHPLFNLNMKKLLEISQDILVVKKLKKHEIESE